MCQVSFIIISYNQAKFIEKTIRSILNQKVNSCEIIVIDGGSTDNTLEVLEKFGSQINTVISEPDKGQVDALIKGLNRAKGEWIAWQNSDDIYVQDCVNKLLKLAELYPNSDVIYGDVLIIDELDNIKAVAYSSPFYFKSHAYNTMGIFNQSLIIRNSSLYKLEYPRLDLHYAFDFEWFLRWGLKNVNFQYVPNAFGGFRVHSASKTFSKSKQFAQEIETVLAEYNLHPISQLEMTTLKCKRMLNHLRYGRYEYIINGFARTLGLTSNPYSKKSLYGLN